MSAAVIAKFCGRLSYADALLIQRKHIEKLKVDKSANCLLLLEHAPVYTVGLRSGNYSAQEQERLKALGADFYVSDRGGLITFHGPGQLVAYPIMHMDNFPCLAKSVKRYVCAVEQAVIKTLYRGFKLKGHTTPYTGVWVNDAENNESKICAIGIHVGRYITSHGLALNCCNDLTWFDHIVPCGIVGKNVTSISEKLGRKVDLWDVIPHFIQAFSEIFECNVRLS